MKIDMRRDDYLFSEYDLGRLIEAQQNALFKEIDEIDGNRLLNTNQTELVEYFKQKYLLPAPVLLEDKISVDQKEIQVDVSNDPNRLIFDRDEPFYITGTKVNFYIPYEGDKDLFKCQPSTYSLNPPRGTVTENELILSYETTKHEGDSIKNQFSNQLAQIKEYLGRIASGVSEFNNNIEQTILQRIETRSKKIREDQGLISSFGFPLRKREDAIETYTVPVIKKRIVPQMPTPGAPSVPEPTIHMKDYEQILSIITNMVSVMERSPKAFVHMDEEDLRTHFLVQLNGQYEGQATGETFNANGKTDILIRVENKNIFIAECKFWKGPEYFKEAIDQLLGYTSWRDTKTALLIFNRNKNLTDVLNKIPDTVKSHVNFVSEEPYESETGFRYKFHHNNDKERDILITVLVFDIPTEEE
jgi:hypothetical protein